MGLYGKHFATLYIPCQTDHYPSGMFCRVPVVVTTPLAQALTRRCKSNERHEKHIGYQRFGFGSWLENAKRAALKAIFAEGIDMFDKLHPYITISEAGQSDHVPVFAEISDVTRCWRLIMSRMVETDDCA